MTRKLKVYGVTTVLPRHVQSEKSPWIRQGRGIIATTSQAKAAAAFGIPVGVMRNYGGETGNEFEIASAMACPEVPLIRPNDYVGDQEFVPFVSDVDELVQELVNNNEMTGK